MDASKMRTPMTDEQHSIRPSDMRRHLKGAQFEQTKPQPTASGIKFVDAELARCEFP